MNNPERYARICELFVATYELGAEQREAVLARECSGDPSLRTEVEDLLASHADPSPFLEGASLDGGLKAATPQHRISAPLRA